MSMGGGEWRGVNSTLDTQTHLHLQTLLTTLTNESWCHYSLLDMTGSYAKQSHWHTEMFTHTLSQRKIIERKIHHHVELNSKSNSSDQVFGV